MLPPAPPPLTELERRVLACGYDPLMGIKAATNNVRRWLRAEINGRLRELAKKEPVEVACRKCGEPVEVSRGQAEMVTNGRRPGPRCPTCKSPERAAHEDAEVARLVAELGEQARELAGALAALR